MRKIILSFLVLSLLVSVVSAAGFVKIDGIQGYPNYFESAYYLIHKQKGLVK